MCFSAEASFAAGTVLIPAGGYCVASAWRKRKPYVFLAVVPIFFGIQQLSEGFVWLGLERNDPALIRAASLAFLFFALAWWPFWFPLLAAMTETQPGRRRFFFLLTAASTFWFCVLYYPLITGPDSLLVTRIVHHSIDYDFLSLPIYEHISKIPLRIFYFLCVAIPMAIGSSGLGHWPGLVFAASAVFAAVVYSYAFVSVWCFYAALLTLYLVWLFYSMPKEPAPGSSAASIG